MSFPRGDIIEDIKGDIEFQVLDWFIPESDKVPHKTQKWYCEEEADSDEKRIPSTTYDIYMFGCTGAGESVTVKVKGFLPYFYVKIPDSAWNGKGKTEAHVEAFVKDLHGKLSDAKYKGYQNKYDASVIPKGREAELKGFNLVWRKDFWGFTNGTLMPFIEVMVTSLKRYNAIKKFFMEQPGFKLYESNIEPFLRFIHDRDIPSCGWVRLPAKRYSPLVDSLGDPLARTQIAVQIQSKFVEPLPYNRIAPLLVASFDLECTSSHGDFPVARKDYRKLANDLLQVAKETAVELSAEGVLEWIRTAFERDQVIHGVMIHQVYIKRAAMMESLPNLLETLNTGSVVAVLNKGRERLEDPTALQQQLNKILTGHLGTKARLRGDPIIQIGVTVNRYGSDEIVYRYIGTLRDCEAIEGAEVESFATEAELLIGFKQLLQALDPDILTGYNIFGFDMLYLWERAEELALINKGFGDAFGRLTKRTTCLMEQRLSSSALGDNFLNYIDIDGCVVIDMFKVMQRDHKLDTYKLDHVAEVFLGDHKNDLKPHEIFEKFKGDARDRRIIAEYCLQDCALVNRLIHKLKVLENNIGMGNVCNVPLSYLFLRGQGVKIFSLVAKECRKQGYLIPVIQSSVNGEMEEDGYEGAIVLEPKTGIYLDCPVNVFDYASLYPSSMISENLSHDMIVLNPAFDNLPGVEYLTISYDIYEGTGDKKKKVGERACKFVQLPEGKKGVIPNILMKLLKQRKHTRKKIEYKTIETVEGERYTGLLKETEDGCSYEITSVDGESWTVGKASVRAIGDTYSSFEQAVLDALQLAYKITANSLYGQIGARTSPIYLKDIAACTTATGRNMILKAKEYMENEYNAEIIYGDSVTGDTPLLIRYPNGNIDVRTIETLCEEWRSYSQFKPWDTDATSKEQGHFNAEVWANGKWASIKRVIRHKTCKKLYRVSTFQGCVDVTEDHSIIDIHGKKVKPMECIIHETDIMHSYPCDFIECDTGVTKEDAWGMGALFHENGGRVPSTILNSSKEVKEWFLEGYTNSAGGRSFTCEGKIGSMGLYYILKAVGYQNLQVTVDGNLHRIQVAESYPQSPNRLIGLNDMGVIDKEAYVYDIETSEGVFNGGVGSIVCSNTDSIFLVLPEQGTQIPIERLRSSIEKCLVIQESFKPLLKKPHDLEYEKTFFPFILFSKKRYVGNLYEHDVNKYKQKSMGIVLKRRDNANIVKQVFGGCIDAILNERNVQKSVEFLKEQLQNLVDGKVSLEQLVITKTLRAEYKDPTKIAHRVLADRMGERDAGNKPQVNDRIPYVYIQAEDAKLQGERIEHPDYIREQGLKPDHQFYITNQIMKPVCQLFSLCVDQLPGYSENPCNWEKETSMLLEQNGGDDRKVADRMDTLRMKVVESLLFQPFLRGRLPKARFLHIAPKSIGPSAQCFIDIKFTLEEKKDEKKWVGTFDYLGQSIAVTIPLKKQAKSAAWIQLMEMGLCQIIDGNEEAKKGMRITSDKYFISRWKKVATTNWARPQNLQDPTDLNEVQEKMEQRPYARLLAITLDIPIELIGI